MIDDQIISAISCHGADNPIKSKDLERQFGVSGADIRMAVHAARDRGVPICSASRGKVQGYFRAKNWEEMLPTINHLKSRRNKLDNIINSLTIKFLGPQAAAQESAGSLFDKN